MKRIWLLAPPGSVAANEAQRRLSEHFGPSHVVLGACGDQWRPGDAVVLFFEATPGAWADAGSREQLWRELDDSCIEQALAADATLIPVLVDAARMPAADQLPPTVRALAYKHALPIRSDVQLPRDVGRLVEDLESQLRRVVGTAFPLEYWLWPVGLALAALGLTYSVIYFRDVSDWSFAYQTVAAFRRAAWQLVVVGPAMLGAGMLIIVGGLWWRRWRFAAAQRAEYYRSGKGELPRPASALAWGCLCAGAAATGWSIPAAAVAGAVGVWALCSRRGGKLRRSERWAVALGLAGAVVGMAWTVELVRREARVREALSEYEAGRRELADKRTEAAIERLTTAARLWQPYANAYYRLAQAYKDEKRTAEALSAVDEAIARYPQGSQGMFGPPVRIVAQAYYLRADLHDAAGKTELAERDREAGGDAVPMFNFLGGLFRFWDESNRNDE